MRLICEYGLYAGVYGTLTIENTWEGSSVIRQFVALTFVGDRTRDSSLWAQISNSIYSSVYLKVRKGCLKIFYLGRDVVVVVPIEYLWKVGHISTVDVEQCNFILK